MPGLPCKLRGGMIDPHVVHSLQSTATNQKSQRSTKPVAMGRGAFGKKGTTELVFFADRFGNTVQGVQMALQSICWNMRAPK